MNKKYIIEKRDATGKLDTTEPQPEKWFGKKAIDGILRNTLNLRVQTITKNTKFQLLPVEEWCRGINPNFIVREKTW